MFTLINQGYANYSAAWEVYNCVPVKSIKQENAYTDRYQENFHPKNSHQSNSLLVSSPRRIPTQKVPTWNIPTHVFKYSHLGFLNI